MSYKRASTIAGAFLATGGVGSAGSIFYLASIDKNKGAREEVPISVSERVSEAGIGNVSESRDDVEDADLDESEGETQTYEFFFKGEEEVKKQITCSVGLKPEFSEWNGSVYLGCELEGNEQSIHSGILLGKENIVTCTYQVTQGAFECSCKSNREYFFEKGKRRDMLFVKNV
ncbi:hypothetical protein MHLP_01220 [Candidatus Mycoplasma haematolamae str. Purdue]|uniref:Uncharacterized protein n=1 Tax=Mycoplasma haematolamae (strain Purdue) TaxID=1212765 RepID=I7CIX6_MYCHA|nr:hypothetical protein [Candidatus Mycoplasma haematolamae]AFO51824.1 hypothetical protein MHLP_01220 [Candidatus Mycoplasma haematolamae str. Purdue]